MCIHTYILVHTYLHTYTYIWGSQSQSDRWHSSQNQYFYCIVFSHHLLWWETEDVRMDPSVWLQTQPSEIIHRPFLPCFRQSYQKLVSESSNSLSITVQESQHMTAHAASHVTSRKIEVSSLLGTQNKCLAITCCPSLYPCSLSWKIAAFLNCFYATMHSLLWQTTKCLLRTQSPHGWRRKARDPAVKKEKSC